ncbi:InlB B-repeat-containing protein [Fibrobacter sp. UBA4309]|uniref:InlB B-repeat-containing protein n=1 Tax=Fibrobacter sp. UBA4309 TaxID=1946537 RepID=UPI0025C3D32E|nr:InlB B-repeat-containing protein [Fibrobacter sp. UBA4309]
MQFITRLKTLFIVTCLVFVGQGFAAWDGVSTEQPQNTEVIDGKTFYLIENEEQLAWFAQQVNSGKWDYNAKLTANLDMSNPDPSKKSLWTPIAVGNGDGGRKVFKGTFDGNKHVISNLYISAEELITKYYGQPINNNNGQENGTAQNLGFIGCLTGTVKNLIIENIEVHGYGKGGLGDNKNLVDKPLSIGTVVGWQSTDASVIEGCYVTGVVITSGDGQAVGGIVGNVGSGTVRNCYSAVDIYASGLAYVGGIAGYTKKYSGNLVTMESCVYAGETLSTEGSAQVAGKDSSGRAGTIIGYQYKGTVTLSNLYYDQEQFPGENAGIGATTGGSTSGSTTPQPNVNSAATICLLNNGTLTDGVCDKNSPWEMGESGPVLIEYSSDGYKITFDANGGFFAGNVTSAVKYIKPDYVINDDGLTKPTRDDFAFVGWSTNKNAVQPDQNLGTVSGAAKFYAVWNPIYMITFGTINGDNHGTFTDGSSTPKTVKIEKGKRISVQGFDRPTSYTENDVKYNFVGWAFAEAPADALVEGGLDNLPLATKDTTLLAVWTTAPVYTVSFFANGSTTASYVSTVYQNDKAAELTVDKMDPNPGYTFLGWYEDLNGESFDFNTVINRDVNLFAKWEKDSYNITYENLNGAANPNPSTYTVDGLALQVLSLDDAHKFEGWCTDYELKNCITEIAPGKTGALTLYAKWSDVTYAIIYRAAGSGATGNVSQGVKYHGVPYTLLGESYDRPGYKQNGWTTTLTGDKIYDYGDSYEVDASITFYPTWNTAHYTITYVCDGCTDFNNPTSYTKFDNGDLKFKNPIYPGPDQYYWGGWFKDAAFTQSIQIIKKGSYGDTTIYAKLLKYYNIDYDLGGKNVKANNTARYHVEFAVELKAPDPSSIDGYTFAGWYDNPAFAGNPVTEIPLGSTGDKTFYAKWIPESVETQYGAITITESNTNVDGEIVTTRAAVINGTYGGATEPNFDEADAVEITSDITVNSVTLNRTFNKNVISTLYVPFEIAAANVVGASVYQFNTVVKSDVDGRWKFKVLTTETVEANTPYVILPSATQVTFNATSFILNTSNPVTHSKGKWEFKGTYELVTFEETSDDAFYVFAGQESVGTKLGQFVKSSGYANPMRAYLVYHKNANVAAKSASGTLGSNILLPDELDIEIENENGIVVQTGKLNTVTGEVRMDRWFDLNGRRLNSRPSTKGTYYKNGKKAIIK